MIETAIAIIATCLPALRSMILGTNSTKASSNSYGRHYELSSARRKANENRQNTSTHVSSGNKPSTRGTHNRANGSEDSLFSDRGLEELGVVVVGANTPATTGKITVNTQIDTMFEDDAHSNSGSSKAMNKSPLQ